MVNNIWQKIIENRILVFLIFVGFLLRLFLSVQIYSGDVNNHIAWGKDALSFGFSGIYERSFEKYGVMTPTYPPIPIFLFTLFYWLYTLVYNLSWKLNLTISAFPSNFIYLLEDQDVLPAFLKIPAIFADLGIAYLAFLFGKKMLGKKAKSWPILLAVLVLLNPAFFYNSANWGQIESLPLFFVLASFYLLLFTQKNMMTALFFALALLTKQTAIVFTPLFVLGYVLKFGLARSLVGIVSFVLVFVFLFLPFFNQGNLLTFPFETYLTKIQTGSGSDYITDHAFNFWALTTGLGKISDSRPFWLGISFAWWGYCFFGILALVILYRVMSRKSDATNFIFAAALIPFAAFLFLTRMHERYLEQALPFLLLLAPKGKNYLGIFLFVSLFSFVNLYHNWWAPGMPILVNVFSSVMFLNIFITITIGVFFFLLVKYILWRESAKK